MLSQNELSAILTAANQADQCGIPAALATVVAVQGSSYRKPGARMLVREDAVTAGGVSGGCLEADVMRKARFSLIEKRPSIHVYDTTDEEDASFGASLNCRGEITILIEPIVTDRARAHLTLLRQVRHAEAPAVIALDISQTQDLARTAGVVSLDAFYSPDRQELALVANKVLAQQRYTHWKSEDGRTLFYDYLPPPLEILVIGAGPEAVPLAALARTLGCSITIVDERPGYLSRYAFPDGVHLTRGTAELNGRSACVITTHNAIYDQRALRLALESECPYIGLLGPPARCVELIERFRADGLLRPCDRERIYSPIGLDIGTQTPEQIALGIVSEIHAVFSHGTGGFLRDRRQPLHIRTHAKSQIEAANV